MSFFFPRAENMTDDLVAVIRVGFGDLLFHRLFAGVLGQRAEQGDGALLLGGVLGQHLEQQGNCQREQLFQLFLAEPRLLCQGFERPVGKERLEKYTEQIHMCPPPVS